MLVEHGRPDQPERFHYWVPVYQTCFSDECGKLAVKRL